MAFRCEPLVTKDERRAINTIRMGDVELIKTSDGVFTGREPHTSHQQMKLLNLIAGIAGTVTCCTGNELAAKSNPVLDFDKTIGLMYYHALLPNQRGTCN